MWTYDTERWEVVRAYEGDRVCKKGRFERLHGADASGCNLSISRTRIKLRYKALAFCHTCYILQIDGNSTIESPIKFLSNNFLLQDVSL